MKKEPFWMHRGFVTLGIIVFSFILVGAVGSLGHHAQKSIVVLNPAVPLPVKDTHSVFEVKGTYYNPVVGQCDADPLITADGSFIDIDLLKDEDIKWVALSRDLLKRWGGPFNYGDTLYVYHHDKRIRGQWIVHDSMNARYRKRIDFLRHSAFDFPGRIKTILISSKSFYNAR